MPNSKFTPGSLLDSYINLNSKPSPLPNHPRALSNIDTNTLTPGASRNSSLQKVWAEDYYNIDYSSEGEYTNQGLRERAGRPPPASQPFPGTLSFEQELKSSPARPSRTHQRSLTSLLPFRSPTRTNSKSPERKSPQQSPKQEVDDFMPTFTGDKEGVIKVADKSKGLASWFTGSSAPVQLGIPEETFQPNMSSIRDTSPERGKLKKRPTLPAIESISSANVTPVKNTSAASRLTNFFSSPKTPSNTIQVPANLNDDFLTLDVESALFPAGTPSERDPFSPAAFNNLRQNATGVLEKLQNAYKLRIGRLHDVTAEKDAMEEELEEAQTRNDLLKANLQDLAKEVADRDATIRDLLNELTKEKQARADEKEARERSLTLVTAPAQRDQAKRGSTSDLSFDTTNEDLGISNARWKRQSGATDFTEADSDTESGVPSTFSRARSPVNSIAGTVDSTPTMTPEIMQASFGKMVPNPTHTSGFEKRPKMEQQKSTFQKVLGKITTSAESDENISANPANDPYGGLGMGKQGCSNCRGQTVSMAWETVGVLRDENKDLKKRMNYLEKTCDDILDLPFMIGVQARPKDKA